VIASAENPTSFDKAFLAVRTTGFGLNAYAHRAWFSVSEWDICDELQSAS